jgi:spore coat polysaccharide biosynthesis predicted glycosyltransferase SpsG
LASMRLVFRADASPDIGTGHVMRCSSIAEEALARNIPCIFVGSMGGISWIDDRLSSLGIPVCTVSNFTELGDSDLLIIDSYSQETQIDLLERNNWISKIAIIDEATPPQKADLYIHPGLDCKWFHGDRNNLIFGSKFIPLRKSIKKRLPSFDDHLENVVVFGGGADTFGFAQEMSRLLTPLPGFSKVSFFSSAFQTIEKNDSRFRVFDFGPLLDVELDKADLVFTTASTSSLEIVAREIPVGIACAVENQHPYYRALQDSHVAEQIGVRTATGTWNLDSKKIQSLISDPLVRNEIKMANNNFIDLGGASRIVDAITSL